MAVGPIAGCPLWATRQNALTCDYHLGKQELLAVSNNGKEQLPSHCGVVRPVENSIVEADINGVIGDTIQDRTQVRLRIDPVQFGGSQQTYKG